MRKILLIFTMCMALIGSAYAQQAVTGTVTGEDGLGIPESLYFKKAQQMVRLPMLMVIIPLMCRQMPFWFIRLWV
jgi:hypothetical protein